jgi:hypothetical protein
MKPKGKNRPSKRIPILHFIGFSSGFLVILMVALSIFSYTSAAGM